MEYTIEDLGFCPECATETVWAECGRCGEDVCTECHPLIGCDA